MDVSNQGLRLIGADWIIKGSNRKAGCGSVGWMVPRWDELCNRRESAVNGWDIYRRDGLPAGDKRFFGEISLDKALWMHVRGMCYFPCGRFQTGDFNNQSLNQTPFGRRLVPRCLFRAKSDGELAICLSSWDATMDWISFK